MSLIQIAQIKNATGLASPSKVIFNDGVVKDTGEVVERGATVVFFDDGTKVVVRRMEGDENNHETALLYALVKRWLATHVNPFTGEVRAEGLGKRIATEVKNAQVQEVKILKTPEKIEAPKQSVPEKVKPWPKPPAEKKVVTESKAKPARTKSGRFAKKA